jgi:hypothetical protein
METESGQSKAEVPKSTPDEVMSRQRNVQVMAISGVIIVLAVLVVITNLTRDTEPSVRSIPLVGGTFDEFAFERPDVVRIEIMRGDDRDNRIVLGRDGEYGWRVETRFNVQAERTEVDSLLTSLFDSTRLSRPATVRADQYVLYHLDDDEAASLRLMDAGGNDLLHLLVGRNEGGTRAFIRYPGDNLPEGMQGVFEVMGPAGAFDNLHARLMLSRDGSPQARNWLDLSGFRPLPLLAIAQRLRLKDGDREVEIRRVPGSDPEADEWRMHGPRVGRADGTNVRAIVDLLMNLRADDIAGQIHPDGPALGVGEPSRLLHVEYLEDDGTEGRATLAIGRRDDDRVAVHLKRENEGELVYWVRNTQIDPLFRPTRELLRQARLDVLPRDVTPVALQANDGDHVTRFEHTGAQWRITRPFEGNASRIPMDNVQSVLRELRGPEQDAAGVDLAELGIGPGLSSRVFEIFVTREQQDETPDPAENEGQETPPETPEETPAETPAETPEEPEQPPEPPAEPAPLRTALYVGAVSDGEVPVLVRTEGRPDRLFWLREGTLDPLFRHPRSYQSARSLDLIGSLDDPDIYRVRTADYAYTLSRDEELQWELSLEGEDPMKGDKDEARELHESIMFIEGVLDPSDALADELEHAARSLEIVNDREQPDTVTRLHIGEPDRGYTAVLLVRGEDRRVYHVREERLARVLPEPVTLRDMGEFDVTVRQVLITWHGYNPGLMPRDRRRSESAARALVDELVERARAGEDFIELQREYNDDTGDGTGTYHVTHDSPFVRPFRRLAGSLDVGEVGTVQSEFGIHILKRTE